jgi:hypothetical protein
MRKRWQVLSAIASFGVMGFMFSIAQFGFIPSVWTIAGLGGFVIACGISLWAAIRDYHHRWPAAVALLAIAPFAHRLVDLLAAEQRWMFRVVDLLGWQIVLSSVGTAIAAAVILTMRVPAVPERIARARVL